MGWFGRKSAPADARPFVPAWLSNDSAEITSRNAIISWACRAATASITRGARRRSSFREFSAQAMRVP